MGCAVACDDAAKDKRTADSGSAPDLDCGVLSSHYLASCPDHAQINDDVSACVQIHAGLSEAPWTETRERAASICAAAGKSCDELFVCFADEHGLTAVTNDVQVSGTANVEGDDFAFDVQGGWAMLGTKTAGDPGDLMVLFQHEGRPWYFKLENFAERASDDPFVVDMASPIKLENFEDNVEIPVGEVLVQSFEVEGAFDVRAIAIDESTGESIDVTVRGRF
jgi:hypothetical protein